MHSIAQGILAHGFFLDQTLLLSDFAIQTVPRPSAGCRRGASSPTPRPGCSRFLRNTRWPRSWAACRGSARPTSRGLALRAIWISDGTALAETEDEREIVGASPCLPMAQFFAGTLGGLPGPGQGARWVPWKAGAGLLIVGGFLLLFVSPR